MINQFTIVTGLANVNSTRESFLAMNWMTALSSEQQTHYNV